MYSCAWTVTESATKLKSGNCRPKQREQLRELNAPQTNNDMRAACMRQLFAPFSAYTATSFELRYRSCTSTHLRISYMEFNFQFFFQKIWK